MVGGFLFFVLSDSIICLYNLGGKQAILFLKRKNGETWKCIITRLKFAV